MPGTVSANNIDALSGVVFPAANFTGVTFQSWTGNIVPIEQGYSTLSTVTVTATDTISDIVIPLDSATAYPDETLTPFLITDSNNPILPPTLGDFTVSATAHGEGFANAPEYSVLGFSPQGILIGLDNEFFTATEFSESFGSRFESTMAILSTSGPIPAGTTITFTATGSYTLGSPYEPPAPTGPLAGLPPGTSLTVVDTTTNQNATTAGDPYSGPVAGLQDQIILITPDNLNITANVDNVFLHSGAGEDALQALGGTNVLDGSTGSNFLVGGTGNSSDTFFVDDRSAPADIWSTVVNFHAGDAATIWGVTPSDFTLNWVDGQGAAGYTGLTLHATAAGAPTASLTLVGFTSADLSSGRLSVSYGTDTASGSNYMYIHENT